MSHILLDTLGSLRCFLTRNPSSCVDSTIFGQGGARFSKKNTFLKGSLLASLCQRHQRSDLIRLELGSEYISPERPWIDWTLNMLQNTSRSSSTLTTATTTSSQSLASIFTKPWHVCGSFQYRLPNCAKAPLVHPQLLHSQGALNLALADIRSGSHAFASLHLALNGRWAPDAPMKPAIKLSFFAN